MEKKIVIEKSVIKDLYLLLKFFEDDTGMSCQLRKDLAIEFKKTIEKLEKSEVNLCKI